MDEYDIQLDEMSENSEVNHALGMINPVARIVVVGCGGGGSNAVDNMLKEHLMGVSFYVLNTDEQALAQSKCENKIVLGKEVTHGLGAGGDPKVGAACAEASKEKIKEILTGANVVFIAAGMGGGTGTGSAPVVARIARECGALTIAIVTRPFTFEGVRRKKNAIEGINALKEVVDAFIVVSNHNLMLLNGTRSMTNAFAEANKVLYMSVKTITDLIILPGIINLDFADVAATLKNKGRALIGFGSGKGPKKAKEAATNALLSPLLEASIKGAKSIMINVTCGENVSLDEVKEAIDYVISASEASADGENGPNILFGTSINNELKDEMLLSIIATEFDTDFDPNDTPVIDNNVTSEEKNDNEEDDSEDFLPGFMKDSQSQEVKKNG